MLNIKIIFFPKTFRFILIHGVTYTLNRSMYVWTHLTTISKSLSVHHFATSINPYTTSAFNLCRLFSQVFNQFLPPPSCSSRATRHSSVKRTVEKLVFMYTVSFHSIFYGCPLKGAWWTVSRYATWFRTRHPVLFEFSNFPRCYCAQFFYSMTKKIFLY